MSSPKRSLERATLAGDDLISTPVGDIELRHSHFDDDAFRRLFDEMDYQRAWQAYIWSTPLVSISARPDAHTPSYGVTGETDFVVFDSLKDKRGIVTASLTTRTSSNSSAWPAARWRLPNAGSPRIRIGRGVIGW